MGTNWDLRCLTCGARHDLELNHGDQAIFLLIAHAQVIAAVKPFLDADSYDYAEFTFNRARMPIEFLAEHGDHELGAVSEYGDLRRPGKCVQLEPASPKPGWVTVRNVAECVGHLEMTDCDVDVLMLDTKCVPVADWLLARVKLGKRVPRQIYCHAGVGASKSAVDDVLMEIQKLVPPPVKM